MEHYDPRPTSGRYRVVRADGSEVDLRVWEVSDPDSLSPWRWRAEGGALDGCHVVAGPGQSRGYALIDASHMLATEVPVTELVPAGEPTRAELRAVGDAAREYLAAMDRVLPGAALRPDDDWFAACVGARRCYDALRAALAAAGSP